MQVIPIHVDSEIYEFDDLAQIIVDSAAGNICNGDILVISQKAISKQEGRTIGLDSVSPSMLASGIASQYEKDPRIVELILGESARIVRMRDGIIIVETHCGIVCANAGVDESNVKHGYATLLPVDPDATAQKIQSEISQSTSCRISVIISDTFGRPFRTGQTDCAIGVAGLMPLVNYDGKIDTVGRTLRVTETAIADEIASAAELVMGKTKFCPAAIVRGSDFGHDIDMFDTVEYGNNHNCDNTCDDDDKILKNTNGARLLLRMSDADLFR